VLLFSSLLFGCGQAKEEETTAPPAANQPKVIKLTDEIAKRIDLKTEVVEKRGVIVPLHLTGRVEPDYGKEVDVSARVAGRIREIRVRPGELVKQGTVLAVVDSPQVSDLQAEAVEAKSKTANAEALAERERQIYQEQLQRPKALLDARAQHQHAQVQLELAESEYKRLEGLYREKIAATKDYLAAKASLARAQVDFEQSKTAMARESQLYKNQALMKKDYQLALAEVSHERKHLLTIKKRLDFLGADPRMTEQILSSGNINGLVRLIAPMTGILNRYECAVGEMIDPDKSMFRLSDLKSVQVSADLPEVDLQRVNLGDKVHITVTSYPDTPFEGTISYISVNVHPDTRTVPIRARIANINGKLRTNMYAEMDLRGGAKNFLAVSKAAIQEHDGKKIVFLKKAEGYEERHIELGLSGEDYVEIKSGLSEGDQVATQGSLMLKTQLSYQH
jgi:cobalt-zinc-cadmium efflux system membrane fusion protein